MAHKFGTWNINEDLVKEVVRVKQLRNIVVEPDAVGKVAIGANKTVMVHPKKKFKNWFKYVRKELQLNLAFNK